MISVVIFPIYFILNIYFSSISLLESPHRFTTAKSITFPSERQSFQNRRHIGGADVAVHRHSMFFFVLRCTNHSSRQIPFCIEKEAFPPIQESCLLLSRDNRIRTPWPVSKALIIPCLNKGIEIAARLFKGSFLLQSPIRRRKILVILTLSAPTFYANSNY